MVSLNLLHGSYGLGTKSIALVSVVMPAVLLTIFQLILTSAFVKRMLCAQACPEAAVPGLHWPHEHAFWVAPIS